MKSILKIILLKIFIVSPVYGQPFSRGVNLTGWFQPESINRLPFLKYTKEDFYNLKVLGVDVIRLPVNLHAMTDNTPSQTLDDLLFYFLDQAVDWAEELNIKLILDNHSFDPAVETGFRIDTVLIPVWQQMAGHYKNRSNLIYYEIMNEPHGISHSRWNQIQQSVIDAIREIDSVHTIIVGAADWNGFYGLEYMADFPDTNLLYTFHFYEPNLFTHQGAGWTIPSMEFVGGIPFPYSASEMPPLDSVYTGTWIEDSYDYYPVEGTPENVKSLIDIAVNFKNTRNVPLFCGEFGVYMENSQDDDRVFWYDLVRNYFEQNGIPWIMWDYKDGFGLFEKGSNELFDYDLNIPLVEALGFNPVVQKEFVRKPDSSEIGIYSDYVERNIREWSYVDDESLDLYSELNPRKGDFCLYWNGSEQYQYIGFDFIPDRDLSYLVRENFVLGFWFRSTAANKKFNVRFVDTKEENIPGDHPWRMVYMIDSSVVPFDGQWHKVEIPLKNFWEEGAWDNGWFYPEGKFDWTAIDEFHIVAEYGDLTGNGFWFDEIKIYNPNPVGIKSNVVENTFRLYQNYPNPFNPSTTIKYTISNLQKGNATGQQVKLAVFDMLGRKVATLVDKKQTAGTYRVTFDAGLLPSGVYIYKLQSGNSVQTRKMLLIK